MSKKFHDQPPEVKEALLGEYSAQVGPLGTRPIRVGKQIAMVLEHGNSAVDAIAEQYDLNGNEISQLTFHLEELDYYASMRLESTSGRTAINARATAITVYKNTFGDAVSALTDANALRAGTYSDTFLFEQNGNNYVARRGTNGTVSSARTNIEEVDKHFIASQLVKLPMTLPGLEQIEAISYINDSTIAPYVPGWRFFEATANDRLGVIGNSDIVAMYDSMKQGEQRGIRFDGTGPNLILGPDGKLTWIDLGVKGIFGAGDNEPETALSKTLDTATQMLKSKKTAKKLARIADICIGLAPRYSTSRDQLEPLLRTHMHLRNISRGRR